MDVSSDRITPIFISIIIVCSKGFVLEFSFKKQTSPSWRIIPVNKYLGSPPFNLGVPFGSGVPEPAGTFQPYDHHGTGRRRFQPPQAERLALVTQIKIVGAAPVVDS